MNTLSNAIVAELIKLLEEKLIAQEPALQEVILSAVSSLTHQITEWLNAKISGGDTHEKG